MPVCGAYQAMHHDNDAPGWVKVSFIPASTLTGMPTVPVPIDLVTAKNIGPSLNFSLYWR